jgi:hypothetical protein
LGLASRLASSLGLAPALASPPLASLVGRLPLSGSEGNGDRGRDLRSSLAIPAQRKWPRGSRHAAILQGEKIRSDGSGRSTSGSRRGRPAREQRERRPPVPRGLRRPRRPSVGSRHRDHDTSRDRSRRRRWPLR